MREACECVCMCSLCNNLQWSELKLAACVSKLKSSITVDINSRNTYRAPYTIAHICFQIPEEILYLKE